jgi:pimeloyl-ACP methyl ester carboxylesterase
MTTITIILPPLLAVDPAIRDYLRGEIVLLSAAKPNGVTGNPPEGEMNNGNHTISWYLIRAVFGLLLIVVAGAVLLYLRFQQDMRAAEERVASGSRLAETACGLIEYSEQGEGRPVLVLHGAGGGYDQGLLTADQLGENLRVIAPSRFGYLNTPIPADGSVKAQAQAYACLLDELNLGRVSVVAVSAGGPSALQFALDYPDRINALVLVSAISTLRPIRDDAGGPSSAMLTDFVYWLAVTYSPDTVLSAVGVPADSLVHISADEHERMVLVEEMMLPMGRRMPGMNHDVIEQSSPEVEALRLEDITAPTLVVHAADDSLIPFAQGQYSADHIPNARLVSIEYGGHFAFVLDDAAAEIAAFLAQHG